MRIVIVGPEGVGKGYIADGLVKMFKDQSENVVLLGEEEISAKISFPNSLNLIFVLNTGELIPDHDWIIVVNRKDRPIR